MKVGIVGHEAAKFTSKTEARARQVIRQILRGATLMVSGHCHLGGIDIWAEEEADAMGIEPKIFEPKVLNWTQGFMPRNLDIARTSDVVHCLVVADLPLTYTGRRFTYCYHCKPPDGPGLREEHIKSGGCWTALRCARREWHIIR